MAAGFLDTLNKRRVKIVNVTQCRKKMQDLGSDAKGIAGEVSTIDKEMDDLLARLTALSAERDRLASRHETVCEELESVEEEHDRLQRKERRRGRRLTAKKKVHETLELGAPDMIPDSGETLSIASRFANGTKNRADVADEESGESARATA